jgi:hypothetical protein
MRIDGPSPDHVGFVLNNIRQSDVKEFLAVSFASNSEQLARDLLPKYCEHSGVICASDDVGPVAVGAMIEARPNVITLMFFATDRFPLIALPLTKFIRQRLFPRYRKVGVHRIECVSIAGYDEAHRWIEALGLTKEAELPGYGKGGETFIQFAWVADDVR